MEKRWPAARIDVDELVRGTDIVEKLLAWADKQSPERPVVIYASADPEEVREVQRKHGKENVGRLIESAIAAIASRLVSTGFESLIVAGGETSGAVVRSLGIHGLEIGPDIEPGVPWTKSLSEPRVSLALKSGNFGQVDFFHRAFGMGE